MKDYWSINNSVVDEEATEEERNSLESWVCESPENADKFVLWSQIQEALRSYFEVSEIHRRVGIAAAKLPFAGQFTGYRNFLARRPVTSLVACSSAVAATILLSLWGTGLLKTDFDNELMAQKDNSQQEFDSSEILTLTPTTTEEIAATLTGAVDCKWDPRYEPIRYGEQLASGTVLRLVEGLAQVTYESGAKVVIRGPSEFRLAGPSKGILPVGQITAVVPRRAVGFVVKTPCADIIDLGTEFAIDVDESGVSEVHVFKGEVVSRRRRSKGIPRSKDLHLVTHEAARYSPSNGEVSEFKADDSRFIREITPRLTESELPQAPQHEGLVQWLAADLLLKTDEENRVVAWRDVLCGDNQTPDDALQPIAWDRPRLVAKALNGQDAVRFNGYSSYLITPPMETGSSQTILFVARIEAKQPNYYPGAIISYNGPPHRDMSDLADRGVLQVGLGPNRKGFRGLQAFVYVGAGARAGAIDSKPIAYDAPIVASYAYDMDENSASIYVDGQLAGEASAPAPASAISRRVIGRHGHLPKFFNGDLGEVLIYDKALEAQDLNSVTSYLMEKYGVTSVSKEAE